MQTQTVNKYHFEGIRWIPSYRDFDADGCIIEAVDEKSAWQELARQYKNTWKDVQITSINGIKVDSTDVQIM